ncbi:hypothetical protein SDC9_134205 [bioreactor metagenome]|uniref:Uncharacterized protein n=1 Tax=bioreactor metagenome TaxID=1076179 RepID=A0A645DEV2_9ZZZZ
MFTVLQSLLRKCVVQMVRQSHIDGVALRIVQDFLIVRVYFPDAVCVCQALHFCPFRFDAEHADQFRIRQVLRHRQEIHDDLSRS